MIYQDRKFAVLGMGRSGEAAAHLLAGLHAKVTVLDTAPATYFGQERVSKLTGMGIVPIFGEAAAQDTAEYGCAVLSPGIDPKVPLVQNFLQRGVPIISEIELAFQCLPTPVIGITGTNGKTTTTELVTAMLNGAGVKTIACGNIGKPYSEVAEEKIPLDVVTLEVSSFQLERIEKFRSKVSVWLNFAPDHLDRYADVEEYRAAKLRIFENQLDTDWAIVNSRDNLLPLAAQRISFSAYDDGADIRLRDGVIHYKEELCLDPRETRLRGLHNTENLMAAIGVGLAHGLTAQEMKPALCAYSPQPHRCELVRNLGNVEYVNDSKATNLDALEKALLSERRPVILIAGGKNKGFDFDSLAALVGKRARRVVLIGEMAERISRAWSAQVTCTLAATLDEAVKTAQSLAKPGETVLFSPGTSSFDMFKSYADRGDQFRSFVQALQPAAE